MKLKYLSIIFIMFIKSNNITAQQAQQICTAPIQHCTYTMLHQCHTNAHTRWSNINNDTGSKSLCVLWVYNINPDSVHLRLRSLFIHVTLNDMPANTRHAQRRSSAGPDDEPTLDQHRAYVCRL